MKFGDNFLPTTGWTLNNATIVGTVLTVQAGGSAEITFTELDHTNLLPEALKLKMVANVYSPKYAPVSFVKVHILYEDGNSYTSISPIINIDNGFSAILYPSISNYDINISAFTSITITITCAVTTVFSEWSLYRSFSNALQLDTFYYGIRISTEFGFEAIRNDKKARGLFNGDTFALQSGDGSGSLWVNRVYFDAVNGRYVFDGILTADTIEASNISADVNVTQILYAGNGNISELTVDSLNTSTMVAKYLARDTSDVGYIKVFGNHIQFIQAFTDGSQTAQILDRKYHPMYWTDDTYTMPTLEETDYPILVYVYTEQVKMELYNELDVNTGYYIPKMVWGVGTGVGNNGKGFIYKDPQGLVLKYVTEAGKELIFRVGETGVNLGSDLIGVDLYTNGMVTSYGDETQFDWSWVTDVSGRITQVTNNTLQKVTNVVWHDVPK